MSRRFWGILLPIILTSNTASSVELSGTTELEHQLRLLDKISYHPSLLPLVMQNTDYLELTPEQRKKLRDWRQANAPPMLDKMREVAQGRIEFMELSLKSDVSPEKLIDKQKQLFRLQGEVLAYKLACRKNILETFTEGQWESLLFLVEEHQIETVQ